jgi:hypothetical protein
LKIALDKPDAQGIDSRNNGAFELVRLVNDSTVPKVKLIIMHRMVAYIIVNGYNYLTTLIIMYGCLHYSERL